MDLDYVNKFTYIQKQPPRGVPRKWCSENFSKLTGKRLCQSLFFNKVAGLRPLKRASGARVFL